MWLYALVFVLGLVLGSFYNVVGLRLPQGESVIWPPSRCARCRHRLKALDLVPLLSWLLLRGQCRYCGHKISDAYPLMELLTALLFTFAAFKAGWSGELLMAWALISLLVIITVSDLAYMIIPDKVLLFFALLFILLYLVFPPSSWWEPLAGSALGFAMLLAVALASKGGMGGGDIKLFAVLGLVLGWKHVLVAFLLSTLAGAVGGGVGLLLGKYRKRTPIAFGPYIAIGAIIAYFYGEDIIDWYIAWL
ncbi:A24 family peptidase [Caldalkalibacillus thermarum TA2.A1]|uniref:Prepilin leader peptidase/N-methyltransferase n=1 Tax=Caldalkalibacillus thermarum (strain TA2.A1) TaxID=986075 RepID=A0A8X8L9C9_CALTT|nr:A24 family peptidase [Caldalkalibacillus thermarum]QZT35482.1 A24 family peptidase [Caldalkalibacillus thermarum TA2.A1]